MTRSVLRGKRSGTWSGTWSGKWSRKPSGKWMRVTIAASIAAVLTVFLTGGPPAKAIAFQLCGNQGAGYCMNAWNGGPYVKMYYGGQSNEGFELQLSFICNGSDMVQSTAHGDKINCPFSNASLDSALWRSPIVRIQYGNLCVGTHSEFEQPGVGYLGPCGDNTGAGAINGAFDVEASDAGAIQPQCPNGIILINRYWTNQFGTGQYAYVTSGGNPGTSLLMDDASNFTCWG